MKFTVADLFCGAGGSSSGALKAINQMGAQLDLVAVNHWDVAIATHTKNHPRARHYCVSLDAARPEELVPEGRLDLLMASPECTFFSRARGGKPTEDQKRMSAWHVQRWCTTLDVQALIVENVPEFVSWGPLTTDGKPDPLRKGTYFQAWIKSLWELGYDVDWALLNAADFGDATTRTRFFLQARKDGEPIRWPEPTHSQRGATTLFGTTQQWKPAAAVIDWSNLGHSILERKRPLSQKTLARIARGLIRYAGPLGPTFVALLGMDSPPAESMAPTPFVLGQHGGGVAHSTESPLPTITTDGAISLVQPLLLPYYGRSEGRPTDEGPVPTITTKDRFALCSPLALAYGPKAETRPTTEPLPTILTKDRLAVCSPIAEPFIVPQFGERQGQLPRLRTVLNPLPAVTSHGAGALVTPTAQQSKGDVDPKRLVSIDGDIYKLDIRFRMLTNPELARAMGFDEYTFTGTNTQITKQIGNAVSVSTAAVLVTAALGNRAPSSIAV